MRAEKKYQIFINSPEKVSFKLQDIYSFTDTFTPLAENHVKGKW